MRGRVGHKNCYVGLKGLSENRTKGMKVCGMVGAKNNNINMWTGLRTGQ